MRLLLSGSIAKLVACITTYPHGAAPGALACPCPLSCCMLPR